MRVLVGCELSGRVRDAFAKRGHDAWSCDLYPTDSPIKSGHIVGNVLSVVNSGKYGKWDLAIFHPPCTYLCNSGVRWLYEENGRLEKMLEAVEFFKALLSVGVPHLAIENPIMHKYAAGLIGERPRQIIQPWMFGHGETKATCLWLKGLPVLEPTRVVEGRLGRIHTMSPSKDRSKQRSLTYTGVAEAMADQWGGIDNNGAANISQGANNA